MKTGIALRLQEAYKNLFETNPNLTPRTTKNAVKGIGRIGEDDSDKSEEPARQVGKEVVSHSSKSDEHAIIPTLGYRDECITVDARLDNKGEYVLVKGSQAFDPKQDAKKAKKPASILDPYCLVVTRQFDKTGILTSTILEIQSQELVRILRDHVVYWPDNSFRLGDTIRCSDPPKLIFHHRQELKDHGLRIGDKRTSLHIKFLLNFLHSHVGPDIDEFESFLFMGLVSFKHLWMWFKPGTIVYERETEQAYYLEDTEYLHGASGSSFTLMCYYINYNGETVGKVKQYLSIRGFTHQREIKMIPIIPLDQHPDSRITERLQVRAQRFLELRGIHAQQHEKKGRVMIDAKTFLRREGEDVLAAHHQKRINIDEESKCHCSVCLENQKEKPQDYDHELRELNDTELLLCSSIVCGFVLGSHKWTAMKIDQLADVKWATDAIDRLVLDTRQKRVLSSLISSPVFTEGVEGDVIGWKGKGLVMLLHGSPGTGKTLTAESVCESLRRPLYIVSGGELGVTPQEVEKTLEEILELSKLWKAVILIDEADVFLEARSAHDIVRNSFVSVFLRRLEYFQGILMLTTNRVTEFDEAFISRIHLALNYPELEPWMRKAIWTNAIRRFPAEQLAIDIGVDLEEISKVQLNGRIISYAVRTAKAIADEDKTKLSINHLWDVVSVQQKFAEHLQSSKIVRP